MTDCGVLGMSLSTIMLPRRPKGSLISLPLTLLTLVSMSLGLLSLSMVAGYPAEIVHTFFDPDVECLNHLVVDKTSEQVFVGGVNKLYQLSPELDLVVKVTTGPKNDSTECSRIDDCPAETVRELTDNVNKALVIDYATTRLISCGSLFQGQCTVRSLRNISHVILEVPEAVVANSATASTVAFIAPGPPDPPVSQVMYVGVSYTANSPYRSEIPAVSSRSLDREQMLEIAKTTVGTGPGTKMFINSLARERFSVNYVHGFSSEGFSYFLTTQPRTTATGSEFISKLVRVCHDDQNYYSYTEIPIDCTSESRKYNLAQAAYAGKAGSDLAGHLGITAQDDVLFAVFSESNATSDTPLSKSALCVYSLKAIRRKFASNIRHCFAGNGQRGLDFISPSHQCVQTKLQTISEDFCGLDVNTPLGGQDPVAASPVLSFDEHLTAVAATSIDDYTVVFVGTSDGYLRKIALESATSALEYGNLEVDPGSPVNPDLRFDPQLMHLYVMTKRKVSKVEVQECSMYKNCWDCTGAKDPHCGWCSLENKCKLKRDCQDAAVDPLYWISYRSERCTTIASVTPHQLQRTTAKTLDLVIEDLPISSEQLLCVFSMPNKTLITNATRKSHGLKCSTPRTDLLPSIPQDQHHFTAKLSVRMTSGPDLAATHFTFFDCNTYSSCTQCVSSSFPCDWCVDGHRCTHDTAENCRYDILVTGVTSIGPSYRSGPGFCPTINGIDSQEILIPSGMKKSIRVKVHIIGQFIVQTRFICQFNIEGRVTSVNAQLLADRMYCDAIEFSYTSRAPNITVPFAVIWGGSKPLDNPDNVHVVIYRCRDMADNCGMCLALAQKYGCGWCQSSDTCEVKDQCDRGTGVWLNRNQTCPNPEIRSFQPQLGPWEGGTNVTIQGINLGQTFSDIRAGVSIAGLPCQPYPELYIRARQIVCRVDGPGTPQDRKGPVMVKIEDFRGYSELSFEFVDPVIESISPKYGPRSGGTVIRITGRHMNAGSKIQATIDNLACSIISAEANETLCMTSANNKIGAGTLKMKFDGGTREYDGVFEYVDDPTIESVESGVAEQVKIPKGIPAGGIKISVTGKNLGYVQNPQMYVYYDNEMFVSHCAIVSHTNMVCDSPTIELLPEVEPDAEHPLPLEYGFRMDHVTGVQNLSHGSNYFLLYPNPIYEKFDGGVKYYRGDYLTINGQHLDRACQESDVIVHIGRSSCNVTSLSRHQLTCRLPLTQPLALDTEGFGNNQELPEVIVVVGGLLSFTLGKLSYATRPGLDECFDCGVRDYDENFTIRSVTPHQLQITTAQTLYLVIENLPTLSGQFFCNFSALGKTLITNATRKSYGVECTTPSTDLLPVIPEAQHHFTAKLSVRMTSAPNLATVNFTFFNCNTYSSCTQCVSSVFPCDWCVYEYKCTHDTAANCRNDNSIAGISTIRPGYRSNRFCSTMRAMGSPEILVSSGMEKRVRLNVHIIGEFIVQTRFFCRLEIEGRLISVNAELVADSIYCDPIEFSYTSAAPKMIVPLAVLWSDSRTLDNPDNIHVVVYRCRDMAANCGMCVSLAEKYGCGWCQSSNKCEIKDQCDRSSGLWLHANQRCPGSRIHSFRPQRLPADA